MKVLGSSMCNSFVVSNLAVAAPEDTFVVVFINTDRVNN